MKINAVVFQSEADPYVPPAAQAEIALFTAAHSVNENTLTSLTIYRTVDTTERISVDWAITNANVTPSSGTVIFEVGSAEETFNVLCNEVTSTEVGQLAIFNAVNLSGGITPAIIAPSVATFTILDSGISILPIPDINVSVGGTHPMSQYIIDAQSLRTGSFMSGLGSIASYDSGTELLTGLVEGTVTGVTLSVEWG